MKFKPISFSKYMLYLVLLCSKAVFGLWLPPLFFEDQNNAQKKQKKQTVVADADLGNTHFIVGADNRVSVLQPHSSVPVNPKEVAVKEGIYLNSDGHLCTVLFDKFYETLEALIAKEKKAILIAAYMLTDKRIARWLMAAHERGVKIEVVTDLSCLRERANKLGDLYEHGIPVFICMPERKGARSSLMHNKFILFESNVYGKKIVWTGSANFTRSAFDEVHHENVIIMDDDMVYQEYHKKFSQLKKRSERYEDCTITNAALHEKIRTSNNTSGKSTINTKNRKAI